MTKMTHISNEIYDQLAYQIYELGDYCEPCANTSVVLYGAEVWSDNDEVFIKCDIRFNYKTVNDITCQYREVVSATIIQYELEVYDCDGITLNHDFNISEIDSRLAA